MPPGESNRESSLSWTDVTTLCASVREQGLLPPPAPARVAGTSFDQYRPPSGVDKR